MAGVLESGGVTGAVALGAGDMVGADVATTVGRVVGAGVATTGLRAGEGAGLMATTVCVSDVQSREAERSSSVRAIKKMTMASNAFQEMCIRIALKPD